MSGASDGGPQRNRWFWGNLFALLLLLPFATHWFQQHLRLYFTEIVVVGGAFTLWALVRLLWGFFEKATEFDAWDYSRRLLSSPGTTRLIIVAALCLFVLWWTTASIYFELGGAESADSEYVVQVKRKGDAAVFLENVIVSPSRPVSGRPLFWQSAAIELDCRILRPVRFQPKDCTVRPGQSTRVSVPGDFHEKEFHLLRLVPGRALFRDLPNEADQPTTHYDLTVTRQGDPPHVLKDLRRQTVYVGAKDDEMELVLGLENTNAFERFVSTRMRAAQLDAEGASQFAATLVSNTRPWPAIYLKSGDRLTVSVSWSNQSESGIVEGFPMEYTVMADKVQTLWVPNI